MSRNRFVGRAMIDRETIHINDVSIPEVQAEFSESWELPTSIRTILVTPLLREGVAMGAINIRRTGGPTLSEKQIALSKPLLIKP